MYDAVRNFSFQIKTAHMFVSGKHFGDTDQACVLPVFMHGLETGTGNGEPGKTVYVGNTFMQEYYVIYDMSQYETRGYLQVGIAPQGNWNQGLAKLYDRGNKAYAPGTAKAWDKSIHIGAGCDQYDDACNGGAPVKPGE